ncbi:MAG: hypothetical protein AB1742_12205 [bacterium]
MKAKLVVAIVIALTAAGTAAAKMPEPVSVSLHTGTVVQEERSDLYHLSLYPRFDVGSAYAVVGANLYFDDEFRLHDRGNDVLVLETVGYARRGFEAFYGDIEGLTFGRGFIVRNYYSNTMSNVPDNEQKGIVVNRWTDRAGLGLFGTLSHLFGGRAERRMGRVEVGATVVSDSDPDFRVWGLDAAYSPRSELQLYAEGGLIEDYGTGSAAGVKLKLLQGMTFMIEFRKFDADFVPGIVDEHYEARPVFETIANNPSGRIDGYLTQLILFEGTSHPVTVSYEDYEAADPRLTFMTTLGLSERLAFRLYFAQQNFTTEAALDRNSVARGELLVGIGRRLDVIVDYYRAYDDAGAPLESVGLHAKLHL